VDGVDVAPTAPLSLSLSNYFGDMVKVDVLGNSDQFIHYDNQIRSVNVERRLEGTT